MHISKLIIITTLLITSACSEVETGQCNVQLGPQKFYFPDESGGVKAFLGMDEIIETDEYDFSYKDDGEEIIVTLLTYNPYTFNSRRDELNINRKLFYTQGPFAQYKKKNVANDEAEIYDPDDSSDFDVFKKINNGGFRYLANCYRDEGVICTYSGHYKDILFDFSSNRMGYDAYVRLKNKIINHIDGYKC